MSGQINSKVEPRIQDAEAYCDALAHAIEQATQSPGTPQRVVLREATEDREYTIGTTSTPNVNLTLKSLGKEVNLVAQHLLSNSVFLPHTKGQERQIVRILKDPGGLVAERLTKAARRVQNAYEKLLAVDTQPAASTLAGPALAAPVPAPAPAPKPAPALEAPSAPVPAPAPASRPAPALEAPSAPVPAPAPAPKPAPALEAPSAPVPAPVDTGAGTGLLSALPGKGPADSTNKSSLPTPAPALAPHIASKSAAALEDSLLGYGTTRSTKANIWENNGIRKPTARKPVTTNPVPTQATIALDDPLVVHPTAVVGSTDGASPTLPPTLPSTPLAAEGAPVQPDTSRVSVRLETDRTGANVTVMLTAGSEARPAATPETPDALWTDERVLNFGPTVNRKVAQSLSQALHTSQALYAVLETGDSAEESLATTPASEAPTLFLITPPQPQYPTIIHNFNVIGDVLNKREAVVAADSEDEDQSLPSPPPSTPTVPAIPTNIEVTNEFLHNLLTLANQGDLHTSFSDPATQKQIAQMAECLRNGEYPDQLGGDVALQDNSLEPAQLSRETRRLWEQLQASSFMAFLEEVTPVTAAVEVVESGADILDRYLDPENDTKYYETFVAVNNPDTVTFVDEPGPGRRLLRATVGFVLRGSLVVAGLAAQAGVVLAGAHAYSAARTAITGRTSS